MKKDDKALWNSCAKIYDGMLNVIPYRNLLTETAETANIQDGMRLLDVCSGTGNLISGLQERDIHCKVTGIDFSPLMIQQANAKKSEYAGDISFYETDVNEPASEWGIDGLFDRFICNNAMYLIQDPPELLKKLSSIATPNARLVIATPHSSPSSHAVLEEHLRLAEASGMKREAALQWLTPRLQPLLECSSIVLERYGDIYHSPNRDQLYKWFESSGWDITEIRTTYAGQNWLVIAEKSASSND